VAFSPLLPLGSDAKRIAALGQARGIQVSRSVGDVSSSHQSVVSGWEDWGIVESHELWSAVDDAGIRNQRADVRMVKPHIETSRQDRMTVLQDTLDHIEKLQVYVGIPEANAPREDDEEVTNAQLAYCTHTDLPSSIYRRGRSSSPRLRLRATSRQSPSNWVWP